LAQEYDSKHGKLVEGCEVENFASTPVADEEVLDDEGRGVIVKEQPIERLVGDFDGAWSVAAAALGVCDPHGTEGC
jgi:hypothetical protein